jgi:hypothetical protein
LLLGQPKNVKIATISVVESGAGLTHPYTPGGVAADPVGLAAGAIGGPDFH